MGKLTVKDTINYMKFQCTIPDSVLRRLNKFLETATGYGIQIFLDDLIQGEIDEDELYEMKQMLRLHLSQVAYDESEKDEEVYSEELAEYSNHVNNDMIEHDEEVEYEKTKHKEISEDEED